MEPKWFAPFCETVCGSALKCQFPSTKRKREDGGEKTLGCLRKICSQLKKETGNGDLKEFVRTGVAKEEDKNKEALEVRDSEVDTVKEEEGGGRGRSTTRKKHTTKKKHRMLAI